MTRGLTKQRAVVVADVMKFVIILKNQNVPKYFYNLEASE